MSEKGVITIKKKNLVYGVLIIISLVILFSFMYQSSKLEAGQREFTQESEYDRSIKGLATAIETMEIKEETINLEANIVKKEINGREIKMYAYNNQIPGPLIKAEQGEKILINFKNNLDVETTVHWHGLRLDNKYDGTSLVQEPVRPGESFQYELKLMDAGLYWYHPHIREDYQQELGLYGMILVSPTKGDSFNEVDNEEVIVLDDILIEGEDAAGFDTEYASHALMGRFGNVMLVNGKTEYNLEVKQGELLRFYVANVANTRTFNFVIDNAKMKLVGSDGGLYEHEEFVDSIVIAPSERYIIEVFFDSAGEYEIKNINPLREYSLGKIIVSENEFEQNKFNEFNKLKENTETTKDIQQYSEHFDKPADVSLKLSMTMGGNPHGMHGMAHGGGSAIEWEDTMFAMNSQMTSELLQWEIIDEKTGKKNMDINYNWNQGELVKIRLFNDPNSMHPMQHPIHFHGNRFLVLSIDGVENDNLVWKDTVLVPTGSTIDVLLEVSNPGEWMAHCHIAEHLESGMMMEFMAT